MKVPFNDLSRSATGERVAIEAALARVVQSGWFVMGPEMKGFESELAEFVDARHAVGVANGTEALQLAIRAADRGRAGTVVTAANAGGYATVAARSAGCSVRYCDVDPDGFLLDPRRLAGQLDEDVTVVVVTHLYGRVANLAAIREVIEGRGIILVEDCAQAIGGWNSEGRAGGLADLATFSFYPTKNLGAIGDGGAIATSDDALADALRSLRQYGWTERYSVAIEGGINSRLDELQAAVLRTRMPLLEAGNARRRDIIRAYADAAPSSVRVLPADAGHAGHLAVVETDNPRMLADHLAEDGIQTAVHFPTPDYRQKAWQDLSFVSRMPVTEATVGRILSLPCYPELRDEEVRHVCERLAEYAG